MLKTWSVHSNFWIRNTYILTRIWIFLSFARGIEAKTSKIEEKLANSNKKTRNIKQTSMRNFEIETLFSYSNISYGLFEPTVCSFQYSGVFATFLLVVLSVFCLFAACVFLLGFAWFSLFLLFFVIFS